MNSALDDFFEIAFSQLQNKVESIEMLWILRLYNIDDFDDIWMLKFSQKVDLSEDSFAIDFVLENAVHLLDSHFLASGLMQSTAHSSI